MTREDAISWLTKLYARSDITDEYGEMEDDQSYKEALDIAINDIESMNLLSKVTFKFSGEVLMDAE